MFAEAGEASSEWGVPTCYSCRFPTVSIGNFPEGVTEIKIPSGRFAVPAVLCHIVLLHLRFQQHPGEAPATFQEHHQGTHLPFPR